MSFYLKCDGGNYPAYRGLEKPLRGGDLIENPSVDQGGPYDRVAGGHGATLEGGGIGLPPGGFEWPCLCL